MPSKLNANLQISDLILSCILKNGIMPQTPFKGCQLMRMGVHKYNIKLGDSLKCSNESGFFDQIIDVPQMKSRFPFSHGYNDKLKRARKELIKFYRVDRRKNRLFLSPFFNY